VELVVGERKDQVVVRLLLLVSLQRRGLVALVGQKLRLEQRKQKVPSILFLSLLEKEECEIAVAGWIKGGINYGWTRIGKEEGLKEF
jgi:hypothetical protein